MSDESNANDGIVVLAFVEEDAAEQALETLEKAKHEKAVDFWDAAVIRKDERGRYYYHETHDRSTPKGAGIGVLIGGLLGAPLGPAGIMLGAGLGAGLGAFAASTDSGLNDDNVERVGQALTAGNSALLIVPDRASLSQGQEYAAQEEIEAMLKKLTADIAEQMQHGQNAAYHITAAGRSVSVRELEAGNPFLKLLNS